MKLLLDQSIPRLAGQQLRERGHDAVHASEIGMQFAPDLDYLLKAASEGSVVVTLDADFHAILAMHAMAFSFDDPPSLPYYRSGR